MERLRATAPESGAALPRVERKPRGLRSGILVTALILALLGGAIQLFATSPTLNPVDLATGRYHYVVTPDLSKLTQPKAIQALDRMGLSAKVEVVFSNRLRGSVVSQDPAAGAQVRRNGTVKLLISRGQTEFVMPDLLGDEVGSARTALEAVGATVEVEQVYDEIVAKGEIMKQEPTPGERVLAARPVKLLVSQGAVQRRVPDVNQLPLEGASFVLGRSGFKVGEIIRRSDNFLPAGSVIETDPAANAIHDKGTVVKVVVSQGPPPVKVPAIVGLTENQAIEAIRAAGLLPSSYTRVGVVNDINDGKVDNQAPEAGTEVVPLSVVNFEVLRAAVVVQTGGG
jgi:serine/threonine-protein kinase